MAERLRLIDLPTEILWRIAGSGPPDSVLALTSACRGLRHALLDALVFKSALRHAPSDERLPLDIDAMSASLGSDIGAWARLAVADSKARSIPWDLSYNSPMDDLLRNLDRYAPCLVTLKHPSILNSRALDILLSPLRKATRTIRPPPALAIIPPTPYHLAMKHTSPGLSFYLCAATLSSIESFPRYDDGLFASTLVRSCVCALEHLDVDKAESYETIYTTELAHVSLSAWASLLSAHIEMLRDEDGPRIPNPAKIPWLSKTSPHRFPLPFVDSRAELGKVEAQDSIMTWHEWYTDCVTTMATPEFFTDGEWCGYWSFDNYVAGSPSVSFAEAIERVQLSIPPVRRSSRYGPPSVRIVASYPGAHHNLILEGHVAADGLFDLGPPGESWLWRGRMTPFGMFGYWGSPDSSKIAGACWLWKRAWSEETREAAK